ncbi:unnamed protein product [Macrosiphum euphorbiae]|uniref:Uncharacterized protein n=1 Tax=Macrosiphum euphorbiae TaxID=13131 RepID=A0AAV0WW05_9HEMI|nr:unnamed protein product [Macrosiphum euphorbiae]
MISIKDQKFLLKLILLIVYLDCAKCTTGCISNKQLYREIGCKPIFENDSNSCPVAYDCENVFTRSSDKCYLNGNVYEPKANISKLDSALSLCVSGCFCDQKTNDKKTTTAFACTYDVCRSRMSLIAEPCYYKFDKNLCCETELYCPKENATIHECVYDGKTYRNGQQFKIQNDYLCVCSPEFNGTANDKLCRQFKCNYELLYMKNILNLDAPLYFEEKDGCPINWYQSEYESDFGTVEVSAGTVNSSNHVCKYGNLSVPIGQELKIDRLSIRNSESDSYKTICTCDTPPLITCITGRKDIINGKFNMHII